MEKEKKYELTNETVEVDGHTLHRIKALRDFVSGDRKIKKGELGGFVEDERNLEQYGTAWISDDAKVYEEAKVYEGARVYGNAIVHGNASVIGKARVYGNAEIYEEAHIKESALVFGEAKVYGEAWVLGKVFEQAKIYGDTIINGIIYGNAEIYGHTCIRDEKAQVCGDIKINDALGHIEIDHEAKISSYDDLLEGIRVEREWELYEEEGAFNYKYKLTNEIKLTGDNHLVFRIKAIEDIPEYGVKAGDLGGFVESSTNLYPAGNCWVGGDAVVFGSACISGNALVCDNAIVCDYAEVYGTAKVCGNTYVEHGASIHDNAIVSDNAVVSGQVDIYENANINENVVVCEKTSIHGNAIVSGNVIVRGEPPYNDKLEIDICGDVKISGDVKIIDNLNIDGTINISTDEQLNEYIESCNKENQELSDEGFINNMLSDFNSQLTSEQRAELEEEYAKAEAVETPSIDDKKHSTNDSNDEI